MISDDYQTFYFRTFATAIRNSHSQQPFATALRNSHGNHKHIPEMLRGVRFFLTLESSTSICDYVVNASSYDWLAWCSCECLRESVIQNECPICFDDGCIADVIKGGTPPNSQQLINQSHVRTGGTRSYFRSARAVLVV